MVIACCGRFMERVGYACFPPRLPGTFPFESTTSPGIPGARTSDISHL
jgi:hypothetical protein